MVLLVLEMLLHCELDILDESLPFNPLVLHFIIVLWLSHDKVVREVPFVTEFFWSHDTFSFHDHITEKTILLSFLSLHTLLIRLRDHSHDEVHEDHVTYNHHDEPDDPYKLPHLNVIIPIVIDIEIT